MKEAEKMMEQKLQEYLGRLHQKGLLAVSTTEALFEMEHEAAGDASGEH